MQNYDPIVYILGGIFLIAGLSQLHQLYKWYTNKKEKERHTQNMKQMRECSHLREGGRR